MQVLKPCIIYDCLFVAKFNDRLSCVQHIGLNTFKNSLFNIQQQYSAILDSHLYSTVEIFILRELHLCSTIDIFIFKDSRLCLTIDVFIFNDSHLCSAVDIFVFNNSYLYSTVDIFV